MVEFTVKCPFIVCTQTAHGNMSRGKNVLRKPVLIGPIEFDIIIGRDMSEKATKNKVYCYVLWHGLGIDHPAKMQWPLASGTIWQSLG